MKIIESNAKHPVLADNTPEEGVTEIISHAAAITEGVPIEMGLIDNKDKVTSDREETESNIEEEYEIAPDSTSSTKTHFRTKK